MGQVLIRNLDDVLIADYERAAADHGRSLEAQFREVLRAKRPRQRLSGGDLIALFETVRAGVPLPRGAWTVPR